MSKEYKIGKSIIEIVKGDITEQTTDAVVNAANTDLAPGGGVAGAIHRAAGSELSNECKKLGGCKTGEAKITGGYNLPARHIIHTVGPIYGNTSNDPMHLASCYEQSLRLASQYDIKTISFPAISTGAFGYPMEEASEIAVRTVYNYLVRHPEIEHVRFVLFSDADRRIFEESADRLVKSR